MAKDLKWFTQVCIFFIWHSDFYTTCLVISTGLLLVLCPYQFCISVHLYPRRIIEIAHLKCNLLSFGDIGESFVAFIEKIDVFFNITKKLTLVRDRQITCTWYVSSAPKLIHHANKKKTYTCSHSLYLQCFQQRHVAEKTFQLHSE